MQFKDLAICKVKTPSILADTSNREIISKTLELKRQ